MMIKLEKVLIPISDSHSVKEAVITLFLANPIIKPERFEVLIKDKFKDKFQKFEKVNQVQFQVKGKEEGGMESSIPQIQENVGFGFQRFEEGKLVNALRGMNEITRNFISYHSLNYSDWDLFFGDFKNVLTTISDFHLNLFVNAISLHYIDEFIWEGETEFNPEQIFNVNSTLLPKEFFKSRLRTYQFTTLKKKKHEYFDRLEIKVDERPKKHITISHNVVLNFNETRDLNELIASTDIKDMLDHAHVLNKETLVSILTNEVCKLIKISL